MLLDAITYFENRRRRGRAGMALPYSGIPHSGIFVEHRNRQEAGQPHGRAQALAMLVSGLGGLSTWRGRGRGLSPPTPTTPQSTPPRPIGRGRDRGFPPPSPPTPPPPLEDLTHPCEAT